MTFSLPSNWTGLLHAVTERLTEPLRSPLPLVYGRDTRFQLGQHDSCLHSLVDSTHLDACPCDTQPVLWRCVASHKAARAATLAQMDVAP